MVCELGYAKTRSGRECYGQEQMKRCAEHSAGFVRKKTPVADRKVSGNWGFAPLMIC